MGATEHVVVVEGESEEEKREEEKGAAEEKEKVDLEKGQVGAFVEDKSLERNEDQRDHFHISMLQTLNPTNPLRIVVNGGTRVAPPPPSQSSRFQVPAPPSQSSRFQVPPPPSQSSRFQAPPPRSTPTPQQSVTTLNSRRFTNKITLLLYLVHKVAAIALVGFLIFKGVQGLIDASNPARRKEERVLKYFLPQVEAASLLSITLAFAWQKALREWPRIMVYFIIWCTFFMSLSAGILLICFQKPATDGVGVCFIAFAIGNGLYACWVSQRVGFCFKVLLKALEPVDKFPDLNGPAYWMLGSGFLWMSLWILAVIGALNFYYTPLVIIALVLSLAWTTEVMRNVVNLTVSRVIALYYLRGMQSNTQFCFQRALSRNLGSACLGSLFVPAIEALRIVARGLNLLEGEDEFMFSCAHCCLNVMQSIFRYGNGWAYVQIAAYGKSFVRASQDTWALFEREEMVSIVDSDMTSALCFLTGVCSGSICVIVVAAWTATVHRPFTATISLLAFFIGYLMTRIAMALPHACVSCYYVCYAENPENRLFDKTIKERLEMIKTGRDVVMATPRVPRRFTR
ncbi:Plasma-membrane choline transporter family protein isoform 2 [Hibiscus syriacus]|uniref:Choline transporter-like protein n=1 Tax=Hibiscus syriacus TaxID=106335 RepID=A0A6A3CIV0_HIBSY|nr:CTL-like protein DDB_G0274487 isoform X1 [Hibiscus syriacus]KAE8727472.1 Plasma-membrane choline transporter family protein isoform 2 [Hibiscus syriacus]